MIGATFKVKFLAAFIVTFVGLNAGGALCIGYCRAFVIEAAANQHCPLAKLNDHCKKAKQTTSESNAINSVRPAQCCPMIAGFIAGPVELKQTFSTPSVAFPTTAAYSVMPPSIRAFYLSPIVSYRGPPKDERVLHITNRVLRI
ncbi:MAG: hypothetical protein DMF62_09375 [Acidobacteria bacterium]|nr:MAG: hypothetical protein DMF62_09375 [Acidobacteriota bacterium]